MESLKNDAVPKGVIKKALESVDVDMIDGEPTINSLYFLNVN